MTADDASTTTLYVEDAAYWSGVVSRPQVIEDDLGVRVVPGATIFPLRPGVDGLQGMVTDSDGLFVAGHRRRIDASAEPVGGEPVDSGATVRRVRETVVWAGGRVDTEHFGHFLTEGLSRLWWGVENRPRLRTAFTAPGRAFGDVHMRLLSLLGLPRDELYLVEEPTQFDAVIIPDQALYLEGGEIHPAHMRSTYDAIRDSVAPADVSKVYLTRGKLNLGWTRDANEEMLESFYEQQGYEVVGPETLPVEAQVALMAGAREVACTLGTLSHLTMFCHEGAKVSIILRDKRYRAPVQWSMNRSRDADVSVVDCLAPILPADNFVGARYYTTTPHWIRYAKEQFGVDVPVQEREEFLTDYVQNWCEVMSGNMPSDRAKRIPAWTVHDFVDAFSKYYLGEPLDKQASERLVALFGTGAR